jgi:hypothetical protein
MVGNQNVNLIDNPSFVHNKNFIYPNREWGSFFIFTFQNLFQPKEGKIQNHFLFTFLSKFFETLWDAKSCKVKKPLEGAGIHSFTFVGMFSNPKTISQFSPILMP